MGLDSASEPTLEITLESNSEDVVTCKLSASYTQYFFPLWWSLFRFEIPVFCFPLYWVVIGIMGEIFKIGVGLYYALVKPLIMGLA